jgi:dimethylargininase
MRVGKTLFVGRSRRTNREGIEQLGGMVSEFGYRVVPVEVTGCLHLKSACSPLGDSAILVNREWVRCEFEGLRVIDVAGGEPGGGNVLRVGNRVLNAASFPKTAEVLSGAGYHVRVIDISELQKAEAALTCSSLIFE